MMKHLILLIMLVALLILISEIEQTTIQIVIVIPVEFGPYVDWWFSFPGWEPHDEQLPSPQNMDFDFLQA
jgi:hypothetical protein